MATSDREGTGALARDIERIEALRAQGRLSGDEAQRLIAVLRGEQPEAVDALADVPAPDAAPRGAEPAPSDAPASAEDVATPPVSHATDDVRWLVTEMLAADLLIEVDPNLTEPHLRTNVADASLEAHGSGWRLRYRAEGTGWSFFGANWSPERIEVLLPPTMGVELDVKAGDVRLSGVSHVRGRMLAGDLSIDGAAYVDIDKKAGDLDIRMRPVQGQQRVIAKAGDVDVTLLPGSDVRVQADVKVGDLRVDGAGLLGERTSAGIGQRYGGSLGAGTAELTVRLTAGSLRLRTQEG